MRKQILLFLLLGFTLNSCGQNKSGEIITDSNSELISKNIDSNNKGNDITSEEILNKFYSNLNNINELDKMMSFRFYQKSPYIKFKETMETKHKLCGEIIDKKIIETEFSQDKKVVRFVLEVKYKNKNTLEQIILIKESKNSDFEVFEYNIKVVN